MTRSRSILPAALQPRGSLGAAWACLLLAFGPLSLGCSARVSFDPEGFLCDPGNRCPEGLTCVAGVCRRETCLAGAVDANGACLVDEVSFVQTGPKLRHSLTAVEQAPGSEGKHVLALGPGGEVSRFARGLWSSLASPAKGRLNALWMASSSLGYIVGANRTVLKYDGLGLVATPLTGGAANANLVAIHGDTERHILIADETGGVWSYDGKVWSYGSLPPVAGPYSIRAAFIDTRGHERLAGRCGPPDQAQACVLYRNDRNSPWYVDSMGDRSASPSNAFSALGVMPTGTNEALVGRADGPAVIRHLGESGDVQFLTNGTPEGLEGGGVAALSSRLDEQGGTYLVTTGSGPRPGRLYYWNGTARTPAVRLLDLPSRESGAQLLSRTESNGVIVADLVGGAATLYHATPQASELLDLGEDWRGVALGRGGELFVANARGDVAMRSESGGFTLTRGPGFDLAAATSVGAYVLLAGVGGELYRYLGGAYERLDDGSRRPLTSVCSASDTLAYAVGEAGLILRYDGASVAPMRSGTQQPLFSVHCRGATEAVACGAAGTVLRLVDGEWTALPVPEGAPTFSGCLMSTDGGIFAAGDGVFLRFDRGGWRTLPALPKLTELRLSAEGGIYALSKGAEVVRFDGSGWTTRVAAAGLQRGASSGNRMVYVGRGGFVVEGQ